MEKYIYLPKSEIQTAIARGELIFVNTSPLVAAKTVSDLSAFAGSSWQLYKESDDRLGGRAKNRRGRGLLFLDY